MVEQSALLARVNSLLSEIVTGNSFQRSRLPVDRLDSLDGLRELPPTSKDELLEDQVQNPPFGSNLTFSLDRYTHVFQTSGTTGSPLKVLETPEDWAWWRACFAKVFEYSGLAAADRIALASSFGPYVQYWASYEASQHIGALTIPLGGMDFRERLEMLRVYGATALFCTPSDARHLGRRASELDLRAGLESVRRVVCTGEPGASLPAVRDEIERMWGARCLDHAGLSEVGCFSYPCDAGGGVHLNTSEFLFEVVDPTTMEPVDIDRMGELVVTALGRRGFPVIRYRTGDVVEVSSRSCPDHHETPWLPGGIIGRTDDMIITRGMNVFPSAIEQVLHEVGGVGEFRVTFYSDPRAMDQVKVEVELERPSDAREILSQLRGRFGLNVRMVPLKPGILPPLHGKAHRVVDLRSGVTPQLGTLHEH